MKKINSINYGHKFLGAAALLSIVLPLLFELFYCLFGLDILRLATYIVLGAGLLVFIFFFSLLAVEFNQDRAIDRRYKKLRMERIAINIGLYECQNCGNRTNKTSDTRCSVCGITWSENEKKNIDRG